MADPIKLACHCGFSAATPREFLDHILMTKHLALPEDTTEDGALAELEKMFADVQAMATATRETGEVPDLPEGQTMRPIGIEDILNDEELTAEEKVEILKRLTEIERLEKE